MPRFPFGNHSIICILIIAITAFAQDNPRRDDPDYNLYETEFNWLEIEDIGTRLDDIHNNDFQGPFLIGFPFPFFGGLYEEYWISSNGFIGFGPPRNYGSTINQDLPEHQNPNNIIALYWKNLDPEAFWADGAVYCGTRDNMLVVQYEGIAEHNADGHAPDNTITMQVILQPTGDIVMQYETIGESFDLDAGTIGVEGGDGEEGFTVRYNGEGEDIADGTAFIISQYGPGEYLVWDAGARTSSGDAQERALVRLGHSVTHLRLNENEALPVELDGFDGVFVNLGNYGEQGENYHALSDREGEILAAYLENGGVLYMEGSDTWSRDDVTDVHPLFNIAGIADGGSLETPVEGIEGSIGEDLVFNGYRAFENESIDHLDPRGNAQAVFTFHEGDEQFIGMVSNRAENYRTIGCSFEFGALVDGGDGSKLDLMCRFISFFRSPPPEFPPPSNLRAEVGDGEVTLYWDAPGQYQRGMRLEMLELEHEIIQLTDMRSGRKPYGDALDRILEAKLEIDDLERRLKDEPRRDELEGFNIYLDGEQYDFTNTRSYTTIELENGQEYEFSVTAVYVDPDGESEPAGPITATPVGTIEAPFAFDFEEDNGDLSSSPQMDAWQWGEPDFGAASGERAWGTLMNEDYPDLADWYLNLPPVNIDGRELEYVWLSFTHYMDSEPGWDGGRVEISIDGGERWTVIEPHGGYPEETVFALDGHAGFSGRTDGWELVTFDLNEYIGECVRIRLNFRSDDSNFRPYAGWFIDDMSVFEPDVGRVQIRVRREGEAPIADALVEIENVWSGYTNNNGRTPWIDNVPAGENSLHVEKVGFESFDMFIDVEAMLDNSFAVLMDPYFSHLSLRVDNEVINDLEQELGFDETAEVEITITSDSDEDTEYYIYMNYSPGIGVAIRGHGIPGRGDVWDLIQTYDLTAETGEEFFLAAHFVYHRNNSPAGYHLVAAAGDFNAGRCNLYHYYRDGEFIEVVGLPSWRVQGWGLRDLAYDGESLYGSDGPEIWIIDPETGDTDEWELEFDLLEINRAIAYVPEEDVFWIGDRDDSWYKINRDGEVIQIVDDHGLEGVVGMAWNPVDPDGACLYIHNRETENGGGAIYRYNPDNGELERQLETVAEGEGFPGGAFISSLYSTHNYVLGVVVQEPQRDIVKLYQLQPYDTWLTVDHSFGEIAGNAERPLTLTFNSHGYIDIDLEADIEVHDLRADAVAQLRCILMVNGGAGFLRGTVSLEGEGDVTQVDLTLNDESDNPDENGAYNFVDGFMPGDYILEAELDGYQSYQADIEIEPDFITEHDFQMHPLMFGTIQGTVTSIYDDTMTGVEVVAVSPDDVNLLTVDSTDENGAYSLVLPVGVYDVIARIDGWRADPVEGIEVGDDEVVEVSFLMDDRMGVRSIRTDGYYDDQIDVFWLPAGTDGEINELHYDDGVLAGGVYLINRDDIIVSRFDLEGVYDILSLSIYILTRDDQDDFEIDRNGDNALYFKVFAEDPETGLPGELIVDEWVNEHFGRNVDDGWTTIQIDDRRFLEGPFYFGWNRDPARRYHDEEIGGLDQNLDHEGTCFLRIDDNWFEYNDFPGDLMARVVILDHFEEEEQRLSPQPSRIARSIQSTGANIDLGGIRLIDPTARLFIETGSPFNWRSIYSMIQRGVMWGHMTPRPRRDLFLHYQIFVNDELTVEEIDSTFWLHVVGSDHENEEYTYRVEAVYENGEELGDAEAVGIANMPPAPVSDWVILNDGSNYTLSWSFPDFNEDETDCEDYEGVEIYMNDQQVAIVDNESNSWNGEIEDGQEGWYNFRLIAFDEVPNMSQPLEFTAPLGVSEVFGFERDEDDIVEAEPRFDGWEWSQSRLHGPRGAHSGLRYWATRPFEGRYEDNIDWLLTTLREFRVETETARLDFYHYIAAEHGQDGGQLLISVDDSEWELLEPIEGYPDQTIAGLHNTPGFTGVMETWELISFDLSPYQDSTIRLRWRFASDRSISWYAGWYIDDLVLWGCSVPQYAGLFGTVVDQTVMPVPEVVVRCGRAFDMTDEEGNYSLTEILPGEYTVNVSKPGFPGIEDQIELNPGENRELDFEIHRPLVHVDEEEFEFVLGGNDNLDLEFTLSNMGDIPLPYIIRLNATPGGMRDNGQDRILRRIDRSIPSRDDPWDTVFDYNLTEITGLERITGVEFADGRFFITSGDPDRNAAVVVLDRDGNTLSIFNQPFEQVGWGLRDLAWDGELLYGSQDGDIYSFDLEGNAVDQFEGAPLTLNRGLAYDPEADAFWAAEWGDAWYLVNRESEVLFEWFDHGLSGVYGLAYHPSVQPDDMPLYALNLEDDGQTGIYRANPYRDEIEQVHVLDGAPQGCFITGSWDGSLWILGGIIGAEPQRLVGLELDERVGWLHVDPTDGEIAPDDSEEISLTVRVPEGAREGDDYSAEVIIRAYGASQAVVSLDLEIVEGFRHFDSPEESDRFMTLWISTVDMDGEELPISSEIAVFTPRGDVGGAMRWTQPPGELTAYWSETGFRNGERFDFIIWDSEANEESTPEAEFIEGASIFRIRTEAVVRLIVREPDVQTITLNRSWNLVSTYVEPFDPDITAILGAINDEGNLIIVKDAFGDFWWPRFNYNGLGDWDVLSAYLINIREATEFDVVGYRVAHNTPIQLNAGWSLVSYLLDQPVDCEIALAGIVDDLFIAKDGRGAFFVPEYGYNGLGDLVPGKGYKLMMLRAAELVYNQDGERELIVPPGEGDQQCTAPTGCDMSLLITGADLPLSRNDIEVIVYSSDGSLEVGRAPLKDLPCGIAVRGDDETTEVIDGASEGDELRIIVNSRGEEISPQTELIAGEMVYRTDSFTIIRIATVMDQIPSDFSIDKVYPNPFNDHTNMRFGLPDASEVFLTIRDLNGRRVCERITGHYKAGWHTVGIDASCWSSGIYLAEISTSTGSLTTKLVLLR